MKSGFVVREQHEPCGIMLSIRQVNQYYGESHTLWDLDMDFPAGRCTMCHGPLHSGTMEYQGIDLTKLAAEKRASLGIGYVPQGRQIFPLLTVEENLRFGLPARADGKKKTPRARLRVIPRVAGDAQLARWRPLKRWINCQSVKKMLSAPPRCALSAGESSVCGAENQRWARTCRASSSI